MEYEKKKKTKNHVHNPKLKEVWFTPSISEHDLLIKAKKIGEFLEEGHKVKVAVKFINRRLPLAENISLSENIFNQIRKSIRIPFKEDNKPNRGSNEYSISLMP